MTEDELRAANAAINHEMNKRETGEGKTWTLHDGQWPCRFGQLSAEDRARMFIDWCALHGFGLNGWPDGAFDQLVAHIRMSERPFLLKD